MATEEHLLAGREKGNNITTMKNLNPDNFQGER